MLFAQPQGDEHRRARDQQEQDDSRQRVDEIDQEILHAAREAAPAVCQGVAELFTERALHGLGRRVDLDLVQADRHAGVGDPAVEVAEIALDRLDLIAHVRQPLLKGDEALHVLGFFQHAEQALLLRVQRRQPRLLIGVARGHVFRVAVAGEHVAEAVCLRQKLLKALCRDADDVVRHAVDDAAGAVVVVADVAVGVRLLHKAAERRDRGLERGDRRVILRGLDLQIGRVDHLVRERLCGRVARGLVRGSALLVIALGRDRVLRPVALRLCHRRRLRGHFRRCLLCFVVVGCRGSVVIRHRRGRLCGARREAARQHERQQKCKKSGLFHCELPFQFLLSPLKTRFPAAGFRKRKIFSQKISRAPKRPPQRPPRPHRQRASRFRRAGA